MMAGKRKLLFARGFTLVEIIIALTILGIGIISVMAYLPVALDASRKASDVSKAVLVAQGLFADIQAAAASDISAADVFDTGSYQSYNDYPGVEYLVAVDPPGMVQLKTITITVRWQYHGKTESETFETQIVKYNPT
ncbi:MAG: prepilin-type N-terminal cleavage/methylation domain-containing protein [Candidatus Omnitrophica bacterium]|nr:prepilin-type N-terminal cleavage/methylation domain-containing protein [Candidatus Omnitrophota bacterium]